MKYANVFVLFLLTVAVSVGGTRTVQGEAEGKYYNDVWKTWSNEPIRVYVDNDGNFYVSAGEKIINARGYLKPEQLQPLIDSLKKSREWAKKAKETQLEVTKQLAEYMNGSGHDQTGVKLTFFSANKGNQTDVILLVKDFENMFSKIELYLDPAQVSGLIGVLEKVPDTIKELKEQEAKGDALK